MSKKATVVLCTDSESETEKLEKFLFNRNLSSKIRVIPKYELNLPEFKIYDKKITKTLQNEVDFLKEYIENNAKLKEYLGDFYIVNMGERFELEFDGRKFQISANAMFKDIEEKYGICNIKKMKAVWTSYIFLYHNGHSYAYSYRINGAIAKTECEKEMHGKEFLKIFVPIKKNKNVDYETYANLRKKERRMFDPYLRMVKTLIKEINTNSKEIFL